MKRIVSGIKLILLSIGMLTFAFEIQPVKASGTIYIRADGSVEGTTDISSIDNVTYIFTDNVYDAIVVERSNIIIDGNRFILQGSGSGTGINLTSICNVTIENTRITSFNCGINISRYSNFHSVSGNSMTNNEYGISLFGSSNITIIGNNVTANGYAAIHLSGSSNITIIGNNVAADDYEVIDIHGSCNNIISGNNIIKGVCGIYLVDSFANIISGNNVTALDCGIDLRDCFNNTVIGNNIPNTGASINFVHAFSNTIIGNNITNSNVGIWLWHSSNNSIVGNNITDNLECGIRLRDSSYNTINHNNLINAQQVYDHSWTYPQDARPSINTWDDGYPSGGNYWNDYIDIDSYYGAYQNKTGNDGVWDHPYVVDEHNQDNYPLVVDFQYWGNPMSGDLDFDKTVDMRDIGRAARAFGSYPDHPRWNPIADLNEDDNVDMRDIALVARNFGKTYP